MDDLNDSYSSLTLQDNVLCNLSSAVEENNNFFKEYAQRSFELQNQMIENQSKSLSLLEKIVSQQYSNINRPTNIRNEEQARTSKAPNNSDDDDDSNSEDENDEQYVAFRDSFLSLFKKKVAESP
ncbi:unnamed protein product [Brachionus calyciflorus]|uniref:Uncharacterized protein n=1 Tax=Brachionus calyciflorus TaxID=104777 RepID=A0A814H5R5_9BILA|nr:unnamed protein product [Brachionus calyciflorus]